MAINITNEPTGIYPAYNDSYLTFTSSLTGLTKALITIEPIEEFPKPFLIYPNTNGKYIFNLKEIVKNRINTNGFRDEYSIPVNWNQSINNTYLQQTISIKDFGVIETGTTISKTYEFDKSVKQVGESLFNNNGQVLNHSINGIDFNLTYFEGYPFSFELQRINSGNTITIKNLNSGNVGDALTATTTNTERIYIDKAITNWTTSSYLPLTDTINKLEIYENDVFKSNLNIKKVPAKCGYYLKWFNQNGGYSYWLFDKFSRTDIKTKSLKDISTNPFKNVTDGLRKNTAPIGIEGEKNIVVKTQVNHIESEVFKSLFTSPSVQLYNQNEPFKSGNWIDVTISGNYSILNKPSTNDITVTIELPSLITQQL